MTQHKRAHAPITVPSFHVYIMCALHVWLLSSNGCACVTAGRLFAYPAPFGGSNANACSWPSPCASIQDAVTAAPPGGYVLLGPGTPHSVHAQLR